MVGGMGMNKIDRGDDKFKKVMDWGTPRLVTKGVEMDQKQLQSRAFLMNMASERKGVMSGLREEEKKSALTANSVNNFRAKMMEQEKEEVQPHQSHTHSIDRESVEQKFKTQ